MLKIIKCKPLEATQKRKATIVEINSNIEKKRIIVKKKVYSNQVKEEVVKDNINFINQEEDVEDEGEDLREFISKNIEKITNAPMIRNLRAFVDGHP